MKLLAPFAALVLALAATIALDDTPPRADLVFVNRSEIFTLDPQRMSWLADLRMAYALYEGLVRWDNGDFSIQPAAAAEWTLGPDERTYTFSLRPDARWSNGDPVTAHDFVFAWKRAILPDTASDYTAMFLLIEGAQSFFDWRSDALARFAADAAGLEPDARRARALDLWARTERRFAETVALRAVDDRTLTVTLVRPTPYFLDLVAFGVFSPVHRPTVEGWAVDEATAARMRRDGWAAVEAPPFERRRFAAIDPLSARYEQKHGWTKPGSFVGNGTHVLDQWRYKRGLRLRPNTLYHSPGRVRSRTVDCTSIEDMNTAVLAFESGGVDWLTDVATDYESDMLEQKRRGERDDIHVFPAFGTDFYSFNCRPTLAGGRANPFADARVRRAFVLSVNKKAIVEKVTRLNEPVATTLIPPGSISGYASPAGLPFDPGRARTELAGAGWADRDGDGRVEDPRGAPFPVIDLLYSTASRRYADISLALRDMWQRELGVRIELRGKDTKFFKEDLKSGNFMIARGGWYGDYGDPTTFLDMCRTGDGNNDRGFTSPYVDELLDRAAVEKDRQRRMDLLAECERFLMDEQVPLLPLCQYVQVYMYDPSRVTGLSRHPRLVQYLWQVEVSPP